MRAVGGLSLALIASLPVLVLLAIWSGDWRYIATGAVLAAVGIVVGCTWIVIRDRAAKRRTGAGPSGIF